MVLLSPWAGDRRTSSSPGSPGTRPADRGCDPGVASRRSWELRGAAALQAVACDPPPSMPAQGGSTVIRPWRRPDATAPSRDDRRFGAAAGASEDGGPDERDEADAAGGPIQQIVMLRRRVAAAHSSFAVTFPPPPAAGADRRSRHPSEDFDTRSPGLGQGHLLGRRAAQPGQRQFSEDSGLLLAGGTGQPAARPALDAPALPDIVMKSRDHQDWKYLAGVPNMPGSRSVPLAAVAAPFTARGS